ncbi:MAG: hypothetical protein HQ564_02295 [Candidatus Saganbacteria bacterium]|nr:hypothetical protein [Candidatus Saganbacteria bacterium]
MLKLKLVSFDLEKDMAPGVDLSRTAKDLRLAGFPYAQVLIKRALERGRITDIVGPSLENADQERIAQIVKDSGLLSKKDALPQSLEELATLYKYKVDDQILPLRTRRNFAIRNSVAFLTTLGAGISGVLKGSLLGVIVGPPCLTIAALLLFWIIYEVLYKPRNLYNKFLGILEKLTVEENVEVLRAVDTANRHTLMKEYFKKNPMFADRVYQKVVEENLMNKDLF